MGCLLVFTGFCIFCFDMVVSFGWVFQHISTGRSGAAHSRGCSAAVGRSVGPDRAGCHGLW